MYQGKWRWQWILMKYNSIQLVNRIFLFSDENGPFQEALENGWGCICPPPKKEDFLKKYHFCWEWMGRKDLNFVFFVTVFVFDKCDFWWEWAGRKRPWSGHFSTGHRSGANIILPCFDIFKKSIFRFWLYSLIRLN